MEIEKIELSNLQCVSIEEHLNIHTNRGDWAAAFRIAQRMDIDPRIKSELMSRSNKRRLEEGSHPFTDKKIRETNLRTTMEKIKNKEHPFQKLETNKKAVKAKQEKYNHKELSEQAKKGWDLWKQNNPNTDRTTKGSELGAEKTKGTKWYHKEDGTQLRTTPNNPRILEENWLQGRFRGKELSIKANLSKLNKKQ